MRYKLRHMVKVKFVLGPAGSGKTHRCLEEIRHELLNGADGPPLLFLAPRQATFLLERQLLAEGGVEGYTRLQILSFAKLAEYALEHLPGPAPNILSDQGRLMVLRALLERHAPRLRQFKSSARLPGFTRHLSEVLRELKRHQIGPRRLRDLADAEDPDAKNIPDTLRAKLKDLADLMEGYENWLQEHGLQDPDALLEVAAERFKRAVQSGETRIGGLWLDGFAEMTPQEIELLTQVVQLCERATLAFCLNTEPAEETPWHSCWTVVADTYLRCRQAIESIPGARVTTEWLHSDLYTRRFSGRPMLGLLERAWAGGFLPARPRDEAERSPAVPDGQGLEPSAETSIPVRLVACVHREAEAVCAARELLRWVRDRGGRFRETAVLVRSLEPYGEVLQRVFRRYGIPYFLDQREPITHHPLAELTRYALRLAAFGWKHEDWFGALKTGLANVTDSDVDWLENAALEHGWDVNTWRGRDQRGIDDHTRSRLEELRERLVRPFEEWVDSVTGQDRKPSGSELATALRRLWQALDADQTLRSWAESVGEQGSDPRTAAVHATVWDQMQTWLENVELAFSRERLELSEWLEVLEAGLGSLSVGVVPPALDQVMIGAIDRSRNPELKLAIVLGLNSGVFPKPPPPPPLLTDAERELLEQRKLRLAPSARHRLGHEWYYGYIACTRASERLVLCWSEQDDQGEALTPSAFVPRIRAALPEVPIEHEDMDVAWREAEHESEFIHALLRKQAEKGAAGSICDALDEGGELKVRVAQLLEKLEKLREALSVTRLSADTAGALYKSPLVVSVSSLEDFAACPFRFFASRGLRGQERAEFEADAREQGSFQHELLRWFHERLVGENKKWRDVEPAQAVRIIEELGSALRAKFRDGLLEKTAGGRFTAGVLIGRVKRLVEVLIGWMKFYRFDPVVAEAAFGDEGAQAVPWELDLGDGRKLQLRGRIDRVDLAGTPDQQKLWAVIMDYKSTVQNVSPKEVQAGLQLQLFAYLDALEKIPQVREHLSGRILVPAGAFYVPLKPRRNSISTREAQPGPDSTDALKQYQHRGRFRADVLDLLDSSAENPSGQFAYKYNKDGTVSGSSRDVLAAQEFEDLLNAVKETIVAFGRAIYDGNIAIAPFTSSGRTACDYCPYATVCRFDPWTQPFRPLRVRADEWCARLEQNQEED